MPPRAESLRQALDLFTGARGARRNTLADPAHGARVFEAGRVRQRRPMVVLAGQHQQVDGADAGTFHLDHDVGGGQAGGTGTKRMLSAPGAVLKSAGSIVLPSLTC